MKRKVVVILLILISISVFSQEKKKNSKVQNTKSLSFSPIHSRITNVNGLVVGLGHYENKKIDYQKINGVNIDVLHPAPLLIMTAGLEIPIRLLPVGLTFDGFTDIHVIDRNFDIEKTQLSMNGLNLSVGGFYDRTDFNGLNISLFNIVKKMNGISVAPLVNGSTNFNGIQLSAVANISAEGTGVQAGISNVAGKFKGIQIGLFNKTADQRGLQIGLWNRNERRSFPFINWQFSKKKEKSKTS
ncbi:LA_2272 family surface repeat-containing protein [Aquimarina litoralis]|uniref:LA_2272 family surface repeat-containing protein n=1 Tax=Aquimarina litoralis TaxID=584605 RepID=UPI001C59442E|nr:hypothetical protein [Aquimarina litoralis]MBW1294228.1 hypothetical protein [Aquimarina litoralis]